MKKIGVGSQTRMSWNLELLTPFSFPNEKIR